MNGWTWKPQTFSIFWVFVRLIWCRFEQVIVETKYQTGHYWKGFFFVLHFVAWDQQWQAYQNLGKHTNGVATMGNFKLCLVLCHKRQLLHCSDCPYSDICTCLYFWLLIFWMHPCGCPKRVGVLEYNIIGFIHHHPLWIHPAPLSGAFLDKSIIQGLWVQPRVVVSKLCQGQEFWPIVLLIVAVGP